VRSSTQHLFERLGELLCDGPRGDRLGGNDREDRRPRDEPLDNRVADGRTAAGPERLQES
jgi:hypothetical protein